MFFEKKDVKFLKSASRLAEGPEGLVPEIALAGRSNSGKSSLINALSKQSKMAKVSSTPGKTVLLNFFDVEGLFRLVDMPGYGYAQRSRSEREEWSSMIEGFLASRGNLCGVLLVMDGRRSWAAEEAQLLSWLGPLNLPLAVVATKMDKMNQKERNQSKKRIEQAARFFPVSNLTGQGLQELYSFVVQEWVLPKKSQLRQEVSQ